jgi:branched-chain amino acid transport system substrate-binding protein
MNKIIISIICLIVAISLVFGIAKNKPKEGNPIRIGAVISLTGFAAPWGEYGKNGINLAVKNINEKGGINGRKVEVIFEDDHTDPKDSVSAYNKLVSIDKVDGVIGSVFDFTTQPLLPLALSNKVTLISPSNFRIEGAFDLNQQSFVMLPDFNKVIRELKNYLSGSKVKNLAVVHFQSGFGKEIAKTLDGVMKENGQTGIIDEEYATIGGNDFRTTITKLKSQKVEAVFLDMVGDDPKNFLVQAKQLGFKPIIISYNGISDAFANEKDKSLLEGVVILNWEVNSQEFTSMYKAAYTIEPTKSADKYFDAVYVLANGIANSADKSEVATYISKTTFTTPNNKIIFTKDHSVESIPVKINIIEKGIQVPYIPK